jgi:hypothetical protein
MINYTPDQFAQCVDIWRNADSAFEAADDIISLLHIDLDNLAGDEWCAFTRAITCAAAVIAKNDVLKAHQSTETAHDCCTCECCASECHVCEPNSTTMPPNVRRFAELCATMTQTYDRKNTDYGDSFSRSVQRYGKIAALTRMSDKWNRLENLMLSNDAKVKDEAVTDTLIDLASYALMTVMELEKMVWKNLE